MVRCRIFCVRNRYISCCFYGQTLCVARRPISIKLAVFLTRLPVFLVSICVITRGESMSRKDIECQKYGYFFTIKFSVWCANFTRLLMKAVVKDTDDLSNALVFYHVIFTQTADDLIIIICSINNLSKKSSIYWAYSCGIAFMGLALILTARLSTL